MIGKNDEGEFNVLEFLESLERIGFVLLVIVNIWQNNKIQQLEKRAEDLEIKVVSLEEYRENTFKVLKDVLEDYESIKSAN